jgi:GNAT superfamily N-acetyltransferase
MAKHYLSHLDTSSVRDALIIGIDRIQVDEAHRGEGHGENAMRAVCDWADQNGYTLALTPDPTWGSSKKRLASWYRTHGFRSNEGRHKDFRVRHTMIREPIVSPRRPNGTGAHYIYVVELHPDVWDSKKFRDRNRSHPEGSRAVYVGSTETSVADRMRVHQGLAPGYQSHWVANYGIRLITSHKVTGTTDDAEDAEKRTAERWRDRGYAVIQA